MSRSAKMISCFDASTKCTLEEAERHYTTVHFPFAQQLLAQMPQVRSYHINRALAQLDIAGGWNQRPTRWRFVVLMFAPGRSLEFDRQTTDTIAWDHLNFLRNLRSTVVSETRPVDKLSGQTALRKYLIEIDRAVCDAADPGPALQKLEAAVAEAASGRFGIRQVRNNRVSIELQADPLAEDGQLATDQPLASTDKLGYIEIYADDEHWGHRIFREPKLLAALRNPSLNVATYMVEERCGLDRGGFEAD